VVDWLPSDSAGQAHHIAQRVNVPDNRRVAPERDLYSLLCVVHQAHTKAASPAIARMTPTVTPLSVTLTLVISPT